jgi:transposase
MSNVLGIDVGKAEIIVALLVDDKCIGKESFVNNDKGFKSLTKWLKQKKVFTLKVCMEATGNYSNNIAEFLYDNGHEVHVVNPVCIKSFAKSKLIRTKTDAVDALIIAQYANITELIPYQPKSAAFKELKALHRYLDDLKGQCIQISNHLEHKEHVPKSVTSTWKKLLKDFKNEIKIIENSLDELFENNPELKQHRENLQTIPGIGKTTATSILAESPDLSSFKSPRQYAAYAGLVPKHRTSGSSIRGKARLSKLASSKLRKALYFPAVVAKNHNPILKAFSDKLKSKGKHNMVIIAAIMRKLLHLCFAIIKTNTPFNSNFISKNL